MPREIKFRAFAVNSGRMVHLDPAGDHFDGGALLSEDRWRVMQYTGLKDRNGVEIYEGDIVRCVDGHEGIIEWEGHDCCFNVSEYYNPSNDYPSMAFVEGQPFEVIGNIYENPELTEKAESA